MRQQRLSAESPLCALCQSMMDARTQLRINTFLRFCKLKAHVRVACVKLPLYKVHARNCAHESHTYALQSGFRGQDTYSLHLYIPGWLYVKDCYRARVERYVSMDAWRAINCMQACVNLICYVLYIYMCVRRRDNIHHAQPRGAA